MANDPYAEIVSYNQGRGYRDRRQEERERAETRYRNTTGDTNPLARPVILPGEEGYAGGGEFLPEAGVVVREDDPYAAVLAAQPNESQLRADEVAQRRVSQGDGLSSGGGALQQGLQLGFADELAGLIAGGGQAVSNAVRTVQGRPIEIQAGDLRDAMTSAVRGEGDRFARERPVSNIALQAAGGLLTGGGGLGTGLRGAVATGAVYGAGFGAGSAEGGIAERAPEAATGALVGGAVGAGASVAAPFVQRLSGIVGNLAPGSAARTATRRAGPEAGAATRLSQFVTPEALAERQRLQDLGLQPSALDVLGGTAERMVRNAAAPAGPASERAVGNLVTRQAALKPEIMDVTRGLSPEPRSVDQLREGLTGLRSSLATEQYAPAYQARVAITPEILSAISDGPGMASLSRARSAAVARRDAQQVQEIDELIQMARQQEASRNIDALPSSGTIAFPDTPTAEQMAQYARVERVPLNAARRTQNNMDWDRFNRGESPGDLIPGYGDRPVAVRREDGEYLIYDGNHRAVRAIRNGGRDMEMYVIDAKDFAPDLAGRASRSVDRAEIDDLLRELGVDPGAAQQTSSPSVSAGTLDRVRIALQGRSEDLLRRPGSRDIGSGLAGRASDINTALEAVPELAPARATYRDLSGALEQLDNGVAVFNTNPQDFASQVASLTPTQREALIVSVRDRITNMLGGQREAGTGSLQTISEAPYSRENLATLLGEEEAARYLGSIQERVRQVQRAARVSPNTNSQTYGRLIDEDTFSAADTVGAVVDAGQSLAGNGFALARTIDRIRSRVTLSPEERSAIVELGLGSADELERIVQLAQQARSQGRPPPREVRAWIDRTRNVLGSQNPVAQQIEVLLLPSRVAADEERQ